MIELRPDQRITVDKGKEILKRYNLLYLAAEVRTGKSVMAMTIAKELGFRRILFLSMLKALSSIKADYAKLGHLFQTMQIINYQQILKEHAGMYDLIICDEATFLSAYPKPGVFQKHVKHLVGKTPVILMSGSPTPESPCQIFHQLDVSYYSPFSTYKNFYAFAKDYVKHYEVRDSRGNVIKKQVKQKYLKTFKLNDYSEGLEDKIKEVTSHYTVTLSQQEAGFTSFVEEEILWEDIDPRMYKLMAILKKDKIYNMKSGDHIVADSPAKMQQLFHQISSGTVISQEEKRYTLDETKAKFIKQIFAGQKIAIYYKFIEEGNLLRKMFPMNTDIPEIFRDRNDVTFICQVVSGRMGVNLATADALVMYNIDFSATSYFQARARMQAQDRKKASKLYWIFSKNGIEKHVYKAVCGKKSFTENYFKKVYGL